MEARVNLDNPNTSEGMKSKIEFYLCMLKLSKGPENAQLRGLIEKQLENQRVRLKSAEENKIFAKERVFRADLFSDREF